jgi:8-oxo-dGTP pyrophosphatase MutT (NUDIX family)
VLSLDRIRRALGAHQPVTLDPPERRRAAVALLLRPGEDGPEALFIERAHREGDPWSGHMAFPGGRVDPQDATPRGAAERETLEEVGIRLAGAESLGRLDDMQGHRAAGAHAMVISAFVYHVPRPDPIVTNHEVEDAFWFPVAGLQEPNRHVDYPLLQLAGQRFPGIRVGDPESQVVWGLTYRFLEIFFEIAGWPLPNRWRPEEHLSR